MNTNTMLVDVLFVVGLVSFFLGGIGVLTGTVGTLSVLALGAVGVALVGFSAGGSASRAAVEPADPSTV